MIRITNPNDTERIEQIYAEARKTIAALGIDQWQNGYPSAEAVIDDIARGYSRVAVRGSEIVGTFALIHDGELTYDKIYGGHWLSGDDCADYTAIHRVAISVASRGSGVAEEMLARAEEEARGRGHLSLRIDTHAGNAVMRRMLEKNGFTHCGTIYLTSGDARVAYERML